MAKYTGQTLEYIETMNVMKALSYLGYLTAESALINQLHEQNQGS